MQKLEFERIAEEIENITNLKTAVGVSVKEGKNLGEVVSLYIDPKERKLSGIGFRESLFSKVNFVRMKAVKSIGDDIVLVDSKSALTPLTNRIKPAGFSLRELKNKWITTKDGVHLGKFEDVDVDARTWVISEIRLSHNKVLPVIPLDIMIGKDEIIVPISYADRLYTEKKKRNGVLSRVFGKSLVDRISDKFRGKSGVKPSAIKLKNTVSNEKRQVS